MEWKNGCAEMQVGFKILLDLLERLIGEDTKIYPRSSGNQDEENKLAKETVAEGKTFYRNKVRFGQIHDELLMISKPS